MYDVKETVCVHTYMYFQKGNCILDLIEHAPLRLHVVHCT